jgi:hypothetical protein
MAPSLHAKKQDSFSRRDPLDSKKDTGTLTASISTVTAAAVGTIARKRGTQLTATQQTHRRSPAHHRHSVVANAAVSAALFWALVQWFDPTTNGHGISTTNLDLVSLSTQRASIGNTNDNAQNDRERILSLLREAGVKDLDKDQVSKLPTWDQVWASYGIRANTLKSTRKSLSHTPCHRALFIDCRTLWQ